MTDIIGVQNLPHSTLRNRFSGQIEGFLNIKDHEKSLKSLKKVRVPSKKMLEKRLWTYHGRVNEVGAARLEHDINEIVKVVVKGQKYSFRESFLRCSQICMIMNMDEEEWEETLESGGEVADKLKPEERVRARNMVKESAP